MEKRRMKKLNKAAVATLLAASGVAVVAPQPTAAKTFNDLNPTADYYQPVSELLERGIVNGYSDGTFRPNQAVTRGQAAKMLALALKLNTKSVKNPNFKDVSSDHQYYPYIAALANKGIINGYSDNTYHPNEPITRGQIAKILTLGYSFAVADQLTHDFKDVSSKNGNAYYIQTLVNLKITKGKSPVSFNPSDPVTRAQLATFIVRAENEDGSYNPLNKVSKIDGNKIYINSIPYTIDSSLRDMLNESNEAALQGAYVEGSFAGTTLKSITKLTLNASGTENRMLVFNGNGSSFSGQLILNGSYIQFKNWTLTGTVTISETRIKTLSEKRLQKIRIASLRGFGFIDWTKPTQTNEENDYLNPKDNEQLQDIKEDKDLTKVIPHMSITDKYIDFTNCTVNRLIIEQNRTYVAGGNKIGTVTVQGDVEQFELKADVGTLYFENDTNVIMYGLSDIDTVYKNSYYSIFFNTNSFISLLVVDNSYGWIDLREESAYIDEVILPKGKAIIEIFDDYTNDKGNIEHIEDEDGNPPPSIEVDDKVIDKTNPVITKLEVVKKGANFVEGNIETSEEGTYYLAAFEPQKGIPTVSEIIAAATGLQNGVQGELKAEGEQGKAKATFKIGGLDSETEYILYGVVKDKAGNFSGKWPGTSFKTIDGIAPEISKFEATALPGGIRAKLTFTPSEPGTYYYIYQSADAPVPSREEILKSQNKGDIASDEVNKEKTVVIKGLNPETQYKVYLMMEDLSGNQTKEIYEKLFNTSLKDIERPTVVRYQITGEMEEPTTVTITFSEQLEKDSAQDISNYVLSGTGNLTGNPYTATLNSDGKTVTLKIPSMAAFVNNDTLIITISNVKDLADNQIISNTKLTYTYQYDGSKPVIRNLKTINPENIGGSGFMQDISFDTNSSGTYYYLIAPIDPTGSIVPKRSEIIFSDEYKIKYPNQFVIDGKGTAYPGTNIIEDIQVDLLNEKFKQYKFGYKVYVVMEDRSGVFSEPVSEVFIKDEIKPNIIENGFEFLGAVKNLDDKISGEGQPSASSLSEFYYPSNYSGEKYFKFKIQFDEVMDKVSVEKPSNYMLEGEAANSLAVRKVDLQEDGKTVILTSEAIAGEDERFKEYNLIHEDILEVKIQNVLDYSKLNELSEASRVKTFEYEDRIKPKLKGTIAKRVNDIFSANSTTQLNAELELTFTEAIDSIIDAEDFIVTVNGITNISVSDTKVKTDEPNKVVLTLGQRLKDKDKVEIQIKENKITDIANNTISVNKDEHYNAIYIYREMPLNINYANLPIEGLISGKNSQGVITYSNKTLLVNITGEYQYEDMILHYMVKPTNVGKVTAEDIIHATYNVSDLFGSQKIDKLTTITKFAAQGVNQYFNSGQHIYIVLTDGYGNVSNVVSDEIGKGID